MMPTPGDVVTPRGPINVYSDCPPRTVGNDLRPLTHVFQELGIIVSTIRVGIALFCLILWSTGVLGWSRADHLRRA